MLQLSSKSWEQKPVQYTIEVCRCTFRRNPQRVPQVGDFVELDGDPTEINTSGNCRISLIPCGIVTYRSV